MKPLHLIALVASISALQAETISYNRDIRPILSENCFFCHGFDKEKREGDLRLDQFEDATSTRDGAAAIVPDKPDQSELIKRILTSDPDDQMPPSDSVYSLTTDQKEKLVQWIEQGANYEEHWAYRRLERPVPPSATLNPIDSFLRRTWKEKHVTPVEKADPRTLLRRLSYDLRGLPPEYGDILAFESDPSEENYLNFVNKWLSSIEHAEHQGLLWLDLVRFADSNGMVSDEPIASGPYRKYVIQAFHDNMPFDQFTREQLAGDLLPEPNDRTLTASAYNRLVKTNCEAGVIEKEALYALKGEHVRAVGTVWLGATTGCAECHDHKYDPISAEDYYSMAAFFDDLIEVGVYQPGDRRVPLHYLHSNPESVTQDKHLSQQIEELREQIYSAPIDPEKLKTWSADILLKSTSARKKKGLSDQLWFPSLLPPAHITQGDFVQTESGREVIAPSGELTRTLCGEAMSFSFPKENKDLFSDVTLDPDNPPEVIALQTINGAYGRIGWHRDYFRTYYWGPKDHPLLKENHPWIDPKKLVHMGALPELGRTVRLEVPGKKQPASRYTPQAMSWIQAGGRAIWADSGYRVDQQTKFTGDLSLSTIRYFWELPFNRDDREKFGKLLIPSLRLAPEQRRPIHNQIIEIAFRESLQLGLVEQLTETYRRVYLIRQGADTTLVSKAGQAKRTHLLSRGNFMEEVGDPLSPNVPDAFGKIESDRQLSRLDLANWLVSTENPLTARVFVNRLWHQLYGRGISETVDDSGNQGDWPSHPHLVDWMASEFQDSGWNIRHMTRLLVTTEAYKLSSVPTGEMAELDPGNRLHARQGRARHTAEEIRDSALKAAGLLTLTEDIPVTSFFPYQPGSYWEKSNKIMFGSRYQIWDTNPGQSQYQRSLYTFWKRQNIHPAMLAFDAPTRQECTARRIITNTPAQALALLNDPQFVEAARALGARVIREAAEPERIDRLFQLALQRTPTPKERMEIARLYEQMHQRFKSNPDEAISLLKIGQTPTEGPEPGELAAWTATARVVLNLHEFITRS